MASILYTGLEGEKGDKSKLGEGTGTSHGPRDKNFKEKTRIGIVKEKKENRKIIEKMETEGRHWGQLKQNPTHS